MEGIRDKAKIRNNSEKGVGLGLSRRSICKEGEKRKRKATQMTRVNHL